MMKSQQSEQARDSDLRVGLQKRSKRAQKANGNTNREGNAEGEKEFSCSIRGEGFYETINKRRYGGNRKKNKRGAGRDSAPPATHFKEKSPA